MTSLPVWELCFSGSAPGRANMDADEAFFAGFDPGKDCPRLRFYGWSEPCVTLGYTVRDAGGPGVLGLKPGIALVRRPTGGGCVFHDRDLSFSLVLPARFFGGLRDCYRALGRILVSGLSGGLGLEGLSLADFASKSVEGWCFAGPDRYDIVCGARKLCGIAQRRKRDKIMFQGSITTECWKAEDFFVRPEQALFSPGRSIGIYEMAGREIAFQKVIRAIASGFSAEIGIQFRTIN